MVLSAECFAKLGETRARNGSSARPLVITKGGASGIYAASSDLAYKKAVEDGADVIDCSIQMSKDGVAFCMGSPDLTQDTTAASIFLDQSTTISEIQRQAGIFSFELTWTDIQSLQRNNANLIFLHFFLLSKQKRCGCNT